MIISAPWYASLKFLEREAKLFSNLPRFELEFLLSDLLQDSLPEILGSLFGLMKPVMEISDLETLFSRDNTHGILASIFDWFNCGTVRAKRDYDLTIINYPVYFW